ncbi:MAG TPA: orotidine-5'-phosphate decarboxylase [Verrucomicrobiae bacterium]|nr:orotidine-5'-phosphate decarboxylase [Verrucomicrobiae bacterium]
MKSKLIVALDVADYQDATALIRTMRDMVDIFKVGSQLFTRVGPPIVQFLRDHGKQCFLDLKFHDIPSTVARAVESAAALHVRMLTVHVSGGTEMLRAAAAVPNRPLLLGVTVLTSVAGEVRDDVRRLAERAKDCGLEGVVASPREARLIRDTLGASFLIVTPGIRPAWAAAEDQERVMTPAEAVAAGADYIVLGRPIVAATDPVRAARRVIEEITAAGGSA